MVSKGIVSSVTFAVEPFSALPVCFHHAPLQRDMTSFRHTFQTLTSTVE